MRLLAVLAIFCFAYLVTAEVKRVPAPVNRADVLKAAEVGLLFASVSLGLVCYGRTKTAM